MPRSIHIIPLLAMAITANLFSQINQVDSSVVALYHFNEGSGDTLYDHSYYSNHGVLNNSPAWVDNTLFGGGLLFDGVDDFVEIADNAVLNPGGSSWTVEVIVKANINDNINASTTNAVPLISKNEGDFSNGYAFHLRWGINTVYALMDDANNSLDYSAEATFVDSTQYSHLAYVYKKAENALELYINGVLSARNTGELGIIENDSPLYIGYYSQLNVGELFFKGTFDEMRISNKARKPSDFLIGNLLTASHHLPIDNFIVSKAYKSRTLVFYLDKNYSYDNVKLTFGHLNLDYLSEEYPLNVERDDASYSVFLDGDNLLSKTGVMDSTIKKNEIDVTNSVSGRDSIVFNFVYDDGDDAVEIVRPVLTIMDTTTDGALPLEKRIYPGGFSLLKSVPSQFYSTAQIEYDVLSAGHVLLRVYDNAGRLVATLVNEKQQPGSHHVKWDVNANGSNPSSSPYYFTLSVNGKVESKKSILIK